MTTPRRHTRITRTPLGEKAAAPDRIAIYKMTGVQGIGAVLNSVVGAEPGSVRFWRLQVGIRADVHSADQGWSKTFLTFEEAVEAADRIQRRANESWRRRLLSSVR